MSEQHAYNDKAPHRKKVKRMAKELDTFSAQRTASLHLLPLELLMEVFIMLVESRESFVSCFGRKQAPLLLTWVCSYWRNTVINTPTLWTTMHLYINEKVELRASQKALFQVWNDRTQGRPLHIFLRHFPGHLNNQRGNLNSLPHKFLNQSKRWKTLCITTNHSGNSLGKLHLKTSGKLDVLDSFTLLYVKHSDSASNLHGSQICDLLRGTHNLRSISLLKSKQFFDLQINFDKLSQVDLFPKPLHRDDPLSLNDCLKVLQMCRNLERARFNCGPVDEGEPLSQSLTHENLRDLTIIEAGTNVDVAAFLDVLDVPSLVGLSIASYSQSTSSSWKQTALTGLLSRTSGSIRRLYLRLPRKIDFSMTHLQCLQLCPRIEQLLFMMDGSKHTKDDILAEGFPRRELSWPESLPRLYYWPNSKESSFTISSNPHPNMKSKTGGCLSRMDCVS
ncbi:hypothetical protein B0H34DRAFT_383994 [Crassisporium funariophilum]|nr:hypothetical protein B0H34DRAFT_383994 [Crassisporium funariophilum]